MARNRQLANLPDAITTDTSNNVGIGGSPSGTYKFEVTGTSYHSAASTFGSTATATAFIPSGATVPTNGMYLSAANTLNFATNTTNRITISSLGSVGINGTPTVFSTNVYFDVIGNNTTQGGIIQTKTSNGSIIGSFYADSIGLNIRTETAHPILFTLGGTERMRILQTNGNVGIGESSPASKLSIGGVQGSTIGSNVALLVGNSGAAGTVGNMIQIGLHYNPAGATPASIIGAVFTSTAGFTKSDIFFATRDVTTDTAPTEKMRITSAGNVGIGTTSPTSGSSFNRFLEINGGSVNSALCLSGLNVAGQATIGYDSGNLYIEALGNATGTNNNILFSTTSVNSSFTRIERMRITSGGEVLIGGTTNTYSNKAIIEFATANILSLKRTSVKEYGFQISSGGDLIIRDYTGAADRLTITSGGTYLMGTAAGSPYNYNVTYNPRTAGLGQGGDFGYITSTRESKGNIETIQNIDFINQLNPVSFNYRKKDSDNKEFINELYEDVYYGFIADEVEILDKNLVFYDDLEDGSKKLSGVHYNSMIALLTKAIQEQQAQIEELKKIVATK